MTTSSAPSIWKQRAAFFFGGMAVITPCLLLGGPVLAWVPAGSLAVILVLRLIKGKRVRLGSYFLGVLLPFVLIMGAFLFGDTIDDYMHRSPFDAVAWRNDSGLDQTLWPPRLCMVDNLMASRELDGLTREQVIELLGPPHGKEFPFGATQCDIHYYLGPERGFIRMDSEWLFISLGPAGKVTRYWLYTD